MRDEADERAWRYAIPIRVIEEGCGRIDKTAEGSAIEELAIKNFVTVIVAAIMRRGGVDELSLRGELDDVRLRWESNEPNKSNGSDG